MKFKTPSRDSEAHVLHDGGLLYLVLHVRLYDR
jgi:hypothetical protein